MTRARANCAARRRPVVVVDARLDQHHLRRRIGARRDEADLARRQDLAGGVDDLDRRPQLQRRGALERARRRRPRARRCRRAWSAASAASRSRRRAPGCRRRSRRPGAVDPVVAQLDRLRARLRLGRRGVAPRPGAARSAAWSRSWRVRGAAFVEALDARELLARQSRGRRRLASRGRALAAHRRLLPRRIDLHQRRARGCTRRPRSTRMRVTCPSTCGCTCTDWRDLRMATYSLASRSGTALTVLDLHRHRRRPAPPGGSAARESCTRRSRG